MTYRELGESSSLVWSQRSPVEESRLMKTVKDQVCGMLIDPDTAAATSEYKGRIYHFCAWGCRVAFERDPEKYISGRKEAKQRQ
jgi:YHS domain-containing protein